jgi:hypothetical protein
VLRVDDRDRDYYRQVWGFDPVAGRIALAGGHYRYAAEFPLARDPGLNAAGVVIAAEVTFSEGNRVYNHIVFHRGAREARVNCTHTVIYSGSMEDALTLAEDGILDGRRTRAEQVHFARAGTATLPPEEHFVALKSYVSAIAETGIEVLLGGGNTPEWDGRDLGLSQPFGFNAAMRSQVVGALRAVAVNATNMILRNIFAELAITAGTAWMSTRLPLLDGIYFHSLMQRSRLPSFIWLAGLSAPFAEFLVEDPTFFEMMYEAAPLTSLVRVAVFWPSTPPAVFEFLAENVPPEDWVAPARARPDYWSGTPEFPMRQPELLREISKAHEEWDHGKGMVVLTKVSLASGEGEWFHAHVDTLGFYAINHPNCPLIALAALAQHPDPSIRCYLPLRRGIEPDLLTTLAPDDDPYVRMAVAVNPLTPAGALAKLEKDPDPRVRSAASWNPQIAGVDPDPANLG